MYLSESTVFINVTGHIQSLMKTYRAFVSCLCASREKQFGEQMTWAYIFKLLKTNEIARSYTGDLSRN